MKRIVSILFCLLFALGVCGLAAFAEGETTKTVSYIDASGARQTVEAAVVAPGSHNGAAGETNWYVLEGTYTGDGRVFFNDAVSNLILADNADWTITNTGYISIGNINYSGGTLNVYPQANNTAKLQLTGGLLSDNGALNLYGGSVSAGKIGGSPSKGDLTACNSTLSGSLYGKNITLRNCTVNGITGTCNGVFTIDGGTYRSVCSGSETPVAANSIVISNATVEASGSQNGLQASSGSVTISDSTVTVSASKIAVFGSSVSISGGNVTATGTGNFGIYSLSGLIEITGGTVTAEGGIFGLNSNQGVALTGGTVTAAGNVAGVKAGSALTLGADAPNSSYTLGSVFSGATVTVKEGQTLTDGETEYTGTLNADRIEALAGKTLVCKHTYEALGWTFYDETQHVRVCTVCGGAPEFEDHDVIVRGDGNATCGDEGYTGDEYCSVCGQQLSEGEIIPPTGEHTTVLINVKEPTATENGYTGDEVCTECGQTIKPGTVIPATGEEAPADSGSGKGSFTNDFIHNLFLFLIRLLRALTGWMK